MTGGRWVQKHNSPSNRPEEFPPFGKSFHRPISKRRSSASCIFAGKVNPEVDIEGAPGTPCTMAPDMPISMKRVFELGARQQAQRMQECPVYLPSFLRSGGEALGVQNLLVLAEAGNILKALENFGKLAANLG